MTDEIMELFRQIRERIISARQIAARGINTLQVMTNFEIGRLIVEHEQKGKKRAQYGKQVLMDLSNKLSKEFGRGFSERNLEYMRKFYIEWVSSIDVNKCGSESLPDNLIPSFSEPVTTISQTLSAESVSRFVLSWSHYVFLIGIGNRDERRFYEIEASQNNWSLRELKRQFGSGLYERLALSRNKEKVKELSIKGQVIERPENMLKEPYVLEFLGLEEKPSYSERDLESAIIDKLEHFLLELGKGFLFEARQKRFTFNSDHFFVDLVFYNRILKCYVIIDLKTDKLTHQDLGQMQMYVNYFDRFVRLKNEKPTIGIILCKTKNDAIVELTLPKDTNIYPAEYQLYLPSKEELKRKLIEWTQGLKVPEINGRKNKPSKASSKKVKNK